jgi:hypothetical protein
MRNAAIGLALLALAGCGTDGWQETEARLGALVGVPEAELVRRVGVPARVHETEGRRFLAYVEHWQDLAYAPWGGFGTRMYGRGGVFGMGVGGGSFQYADRYCEATFEVAEGRVAGVILRGNACGWSGWPAVLPP